MLLHFVTTNKHKFIEASDIMRQYGINLKQLDQSYEENHDASLEQIAQQAAGILAQQLQKTVICEDTGLFFQAYPQFPGALPKFVFNTLGYQGIFKLLAGESRQAYFKTALAIAQPDSQPVLFTATMIGTITEKIHHPRKDVMPYDRIFIPAGQTQTISSMTLKKKNSFSQRSQAFHQLGQYLINQQQEKSHR